MGTRDATRYKDKVTTVITINPRIQLRRYLRAKLNRTMTAPAIAGICWPSGEDPQIGHSRWMRSEMMLVSVHECVLCRMTCMARGRERSSGHVP